MRIFVAIASFCDEDCANTVADIFATAKYPEYISVGICWQYDPDIMPMLCPTPVGHNRNVRQTSCHYLNSEGAGWARSKAHELHQDEDFILQIDAHMRFVEHWDEFLIDCYNQCPHQDVVLTAHCPEINDRHKLYHNIHYFNRIIVVEVAEENSAQLVHLSCQTLPYVPAQPFLAGSIIFNFVAAPAKIFKQVPIDPFIYFRGAETTQAARFWTHGFDIYQPNVNLAYHKWERPPSPYKNLDNDAGLASRARVRHLLDIEPTTDPQALEGIEYYGLGSVRSLKDYFTFLGYDPIQKTLNETALNGTWDKHVFNPD